MTFEWDENKNSENIRKHQVSFEKAQDTFFDANRMILEDLKNRRRNFDSAFYKPWDEY